MKRILGNARLLAGAAPLALLVAGQAHAQTAPADTAQRAAPDAGLVDSEAQAGEDIIVVGTAGGGTRRQDASSVSTTTWPLWLQCWRVSAVPPRSSDS